MWLMDSVVAACSEHANSGLCWSARSAHGPHNSTGNALASRKMQDHAESLGCHCVECQRTMPSPAMQMS